MILQQVGLFEVLMAGRPIFFRSIHWRFAPNSTGLVDLHCSAAFCPCRIFFPFVAYEIMKSYEYRHYSLDPVVEAKLVGQEDASFR
jgi:uncharacterized membrane protein